MTKESKYNIDHPRLIFSETFADEQSVRRNGNIPTDITFSDGTAYYVDTLSPSIVLGETLSFSSNQDASFRIRFSLTDISKQYVLLGGDTQVSYIAIQPVSNRIYVKDKSTGWNVYMSYLSPLVANQWYDFVLVKNGTAWNFYIDGVFQVNGTHANELYMIKYIGVRSDGALELNGYIDLIEIYNYALTQSEIANMAGI